MDREREYHSFGASGGGGGGGGFGGHDGGFGRGRGRSKRPLASAMGCLICCAEADLDNRSHNGLQPDDGPLDEASNSPLQGRHLGRDGTT